MNVGWEPYYRIWPCFVPDTLMSLIAAFLGAQTTPMALGLVQAPTKSELRALLYAAVDGLCVQLKALHRTTPYWIKITFS